MVFHHLWTYGTHLGYLETRLHQNLPGDSNTAQLADRRSPSLEFPKAKMKVRCNGWPRSQQVCQRIPSFGMLDVLGRGQVRDVRSWPLSSRSFKILKSRRRRSSSRWLKVLTKPSNLPSLKSSLIHWRWRLRSKKRSKRMQKYAKTVWLCVDMSWHGCNAWQSTWQKM